MLCEGQVREKKSVFAQFLITTYRITSPKMMLKSLWKIDTALTTNFCAVFWEREVLEMVLVTFIYYFKLK